jgi:hypothetical protein
MFKIVIPTQTRQALKNAFLFSVEANKKLQACILLFDGPGVPLERQADDLLMGFCHCKLNEFSRVTKIFLLTLVSTEKGSK